MTREELVELYLRRFAGRPDVYAVRYEFRDGDPQYWPSNYSGDSEFVRDVISKTVTEIGSAEYGAEAVEAHIYGEHFLGTYPLHEDSTVKFFVLDFDGKHGDPWEEARDQRETFLKHAGIKTYLERSRSGNGYHLWGFLDEPMDAAKVRRALRQYIDSATTYDRMFPNQDSVYPGRPLGNLIALPLYGPGVAEGKGVFVQVGVFGEPVEIKDQKQFLADMETVSVDKLYELYQDAPEFTDKKLPQFDNVRGGPKDEEEGLPGIYKVTSKTYGCEWVRWQWEHPEEVGEPEWYALACQFAQLAHGRSVFHEFSSRDPTRYNVKATDVKFDHALRQNKPHTCEYIRENLKGPPCNCDKRFPDKVIHPYDLAKLSMDELMESVERENFIQVGIDGIREAIQWAKEVENNPDLGIGYKYGIPALDERTNLRNSELIVVGGRPGGGKSGLAVDVAYNLAMDQGVPVYIFSMEMSRDQIWRRFLARASSVDHGRIITGRLTREDWSAINNAAKELEEKDFPIVVDDHTRKTDELLDIAGELMYKHGPGVVMIDYLQLARKNPGESTYDAVSRFAYEYKYMSKILDCPVLALTQLNRTADDATTDSQTYDSWLRGSGDLEQSSDVILFLLGERGPGIVERSIVVHKERHRGAGHRISLEFNQPIMQFGTPGTWLTTAHGHTPSRGPLRVRPLRPSLVADKSGLWNNN